MAAASIALAALLLGASPVSPVPPGPPASNVVTPRTAAAARAAEWLATTLALPEWRTTESNVTAANALSKRHFVEATTACLLLESEEANVPPDRRAELLATTKRRIGAAVLTEGAPFANWLDGVAGLAVLEEAARGAPDRDALARLVHGFEERQNGEGGWAHGIAMMDFYPTTLIASTAWALVALGGARRAGVPVDESVIDDALRLLGDVQGAGGGFPYGGRCYRKGIEAGRTAAVVFGLAALGATDHDTFRNAAAYVATNVARIPEGHASPALHVLAGACAALVLGGTVATDYERDVIERVLACQDEDGSFHDVLGVSPDSMDLLGDPLTNRAYVTALYALALAAPRSRFLASLMPGAAGASNASPIATSGENIATHEPTLAARWTIAEPGARRVALAGDAMFVLCADGDVIVRSQADGKERSRRTLVAGGLPPRSELIGLDGWPVLWAPPGDAELPQSLAVSLRPTNEEATTLLALDPVSGKTAFRAPARASVAALAAMSGELYVLYRSGGLDALALDGGALARQYPTPSLLVNTTCAPLGAGRVAVGDEARLTVYRSDGSVDWTWRTRGPRGITPPAIAVLAASGEAIAAGCTDGALVWRDANTGKERGRTTLEGALAALAWSSPERLVAATWDGLVSAVDVSANPPKVAWRVDAARGREAHVPVELLRTDSVIWAASRASERLLAIEPADGAVRATIELPAGSTWSAGGERAAVVIDGDVRGFDLHEGPSRPRDSR